MTTNIEKEKNINYFYSNLSIFQKDVAYNHKYLVISSQEIKGVYDNFSKALEFAASHLSPDEFIIQQVISDDEQINFLTLAI